MAFVKPGLFIRFDPVEPEAPVVFDVSRSGREYPPDFRSPLPFTHLHDNVSMYVEDLFAAASENGATMLYACFPNTYIDVNRSVLDIDSDLIDGSWPVPLEPTASARGLGLLKSTSRYGDPLQERKLTVAEVEERIDRYHAPYHAELKRLIKDKHRRFGTALQISCHCMSAVGAPTHSDAGQERADFCIGDNNGTTASREPVALIVETLRSYGYSVTINTPYVGGELMTQNGAPTWGIDSLMIEVNKRLFMSIESFQKTDGFDGVQKSLTSLTQVITDYARERVTV